MVGALAATLAAGIAHDFNNILTVIMGNIDFIGYALPEDDPLQRETEEISIAAKRAADLTRQLLSFSRKQIMDPQDTDLNGVVAGIQKMLHRLVPENCRIDLDLHEGPLRAFADPSQIEQVILNLVVNARDAIEGHGVITIRTTEHPPLPRPRGTLHRTARRVGPPHGGAVGG